MYNHMDDMGIQYELKEILEMTQVSQVEQMMLLNADQYFNGRPGPFIKWVGGKTQLLKQFEPLFPTHFNHYYEPFVGSAAVFFYLLPPAATLSDSNPNLVYAYRHIQGHVDELLTILYDLRSQYHRMSSQQQEQEYYRVRDRYNQLPVGTMEKTALLIFLNKTGYNGLYRESKRGGYNVPFGRYDNPSLFEEANLRAVSRALRNIVIRHADFSAVVNDAHEGDFVYFDPPYVPLNKTSSFTSYTKDEFSLEQQTRLANVAQQLSDAGVKVMLSNSNSDVIRELYRNWHLHEVQASRAVNSKADSRGKITELVVTNYLG